MLASIHPLGERARHSRWWLTTAAHIVGSACGGALVGIALGATGHLALGGLVSFRMSPHTRAAVLTAACAVAALTDMSRRQPPWPVRRQVDDRWLHRYRGWAYGAGFGFQLGIGAVTIVTTAAVPAALFLAFLAATVPAGAVVGTAFGLSRALPLLATVRIDTPARLWAFQRRFQAGDGAARWATVTSLGAAATAGLVLAV